MASTPAPGSVFSRVLSSRKGALVLLVVLLALVFAGGIVAQMVRGAMPATAGLSLIFGSLFLTAATSIRAIDGWAAEDSAAKGAPTLADVTNVAGPLLAAAPAVLGSISEGDAAKLAAALVGALVRNHGLELASAPADPVLAVTPAAPSSVAVAP